MKYVILVGDGMADYPRPELSNKTPLQFAYKPNMDKMAKMGDIGMVKTVPNGFPPGSDVANLSVMGYAPEKYYTGRSPLEAVSMGVELKDNDVAFRCNLVTLSGEQTYSKKTMIDYSAGEISSEEAGALINVIDGELGSGDKQFFPGISYRHLMVWRGGPVDTVLTPPHDISDQPVEEHLPKGQGGQTLLDIMKKSNDILKQHRVNRERERAGVRAANSVWLWGQGKKPALPLFKDLYGLEGAVISAVDLIMGIGICAGMQVIKVPGATGNIHTNFSGKAKATLKALEAGTEFIYLHVEAPDEAGHQGDTQTKIKAIEAIDSQILGPLLENLGGLGQYKIMLLPDHPTPLSIRTHTAEPVPYVILKSGQNNSTLNTYDEETAASAGIMIPDGPALVKNFLSR